MLKPSEPLEGRNGQGEGLARCGLTVHAKCARSGASRLLIVQPVVDTLARRVFGDAGAFLNLAFKLFALAGNFVEIVIRKMTPLLLDLAFELLPVSSMRFQSIANSVSCFVAKRAATFGCGPLQT